MHLSANTIDELGAAVDRVDEVDEAVDLGIDAVEAVSQRHRTVNAAQAQSTAPNTHL